MRDLVSTFLILEEVDSRHTLEMQSVFPGVQVGQFLLRAAWPVWRREIERSALMFWSSG